MHSGNKVGHFKKWGVAMAAPHLHKAPVATSGKPPVPEARLWFARQRKGAESIFRRMPHQAAQSSLSLAGSLTQE